MLWCWSDIVLWKIVQGELIAVSASAQLSVLPHLAGHHQHRTNLGVWGYDSVCMRGTDTRVGCSWFDIGHGNRGERYFQSRVADSKLGDHSCERCGCCVWLVFPATKFSMLPLLAKCWSRSRSGPDHPGLLRSCWVSARLQPAKAATDAVYCGVRLAVGFVPMLCGS
eukprot:1996590-Rhodomonas_salina.2